MSASRADRPTTRAARAKAGPARVLHGVALAGLVLASTFRPSAAESDFGFTFCVLPLRPSCIDAAATYATKDSVKACDEAVRRYEDSTFAYRACMGRELQRAILDVNNAVDLFKCRSTPRQHCP